MNKNGMLFSTIILCCTMFFVGRATVILTDNKNDDEQHVCEGLDNHTSIEAIKSTFVYGYALGATHVVTENISTMPPSEVKEFTKVQSELYMNEYWSHLVDTIHN